jgi:hypothetical protein
MPASPTCSATRWWRRSSLDNLNRSGYTPARSRHRPISGGANGMGRPVARAERPDGRRAGTRQRARKATEHPVQRVASVPRSSCPRSLLRTGSATAETVPTLPHKGLGRETGEVLPGAYNNGHPLRPGAGRHARAPAVSSPVLNQPTVVPGGVGVLQHPSTPFGSSSVEPAETRRSRPPGAVSTSGLGYARPCARRERGGAGRRLGASVCSPPFAEPRQCPVRARERG